MINQLLLSGFFAFFAAVAYAVWFVRGLHLGPKEGWSADLLARRPGFCVAALLAFAIDFWLPRV